MVTYDSRTRRVLTRHPDTACAAIERIEAALGRDEDGALQVRYQMMGAAGRVIAAALGREPQPQRRDELWRHTCCELFVRDADGNGYREYNFAPCGDWAAYEFSDYRKDRALLDTAAPRVVLDRSAAELTVNVTLDDQALVSFGAHRVGLACVVETAMGLSYWALAHPPGRPDFHHACAFALTPALEHPAESAG